MNVAFWGPGMESAVGMELGWGLGRLPVPPHLMLIPRHFHHFLILCVLGELLLSQRVLSFIISSHVTWPVWYTGLKQLKELMLVCDAGVMISDVHLSLNSLSILKWPTNQHYWGSSLIHQLWALIVSVQHILSQDYFLTTLWNKIDMAKKWPI